MANIRRVVTSGTTIVKRIAVGTPLKIGETFNGNLRDLSDVNGTGFDSDNTLLIWNDSTGEFEAADVDEIISASIGSVVTTQLLSSNTFRLIDSEDNTILRIYDANFPVPPTNEQKRIAVFTTGDSSQGFVFASENFAITDLNANTFLRTYQDSGNIELYYDGVHRLETKDYGIEVFGSVHADSGVFGNLLPSADSTYNLGSEEFRWKDLYLSGNSIYLGDIILKDSNGTLSIVDSSGNQIGVDISSSTPNLENNTTTELAEGDNLYYTTARVDSAFDVKLATKSTDDLTEGANLYYTTTRADSDFDVRITTKTTDDITEGSNLYYTEERDNSAFDTRLATKTTDDLTEGSNLYYTSARANTDFDVRLDTKTTDDIAEGDNLYYTTDRADSAAKRAITGGTGITYTASSGTIDLTNSGVVAGTYGSASQVPIFSINAQGQVDSATTVSVAGVSTFTFDSSNATLNIGTADGGSFNARIGLSSFSSTDIAEGTNQYFTQERARSSISLTTDSDLFAYDSTTGIISVQETKIARTDREEIFEAGIRLPDNQKITFCDGIAEIFENGGDFFIRRTNVDAPGESGGDIYIMSRDSGTLHIQSFDGSRSLAHFIDHGGVQLYYDGNLKFEVKENLVDVTDKLRVGNDLTVLGNLTVDGTQTIINSTTLSVNDKNIILADSAADSNAASGAGITIAGANATITYNAITDTWDLNKPLGSTVNHLENFTTTNLDEGTNKYYLKSRVDSDVNQGFTDRTTSDLVEGTNLYYTTSRADSAFDIRLATKSTSDIVEGSNLYYTTLRADSAFDVRFPTKSTTDLAEGTNLYYTTVRADSAFDDRLATKSTDDLTEGDNLYYTTARADSAFDIRIATKSTTDLTEGDNLYYTTARADSDAKNALTGGTGITYTASTGTIDITNTGVNAGTYGSASLVPVLNVNAQGQVDSIGTVSVAGVSSTSFDSATGIFTINTADGGIFNTTILDSDLTASRARSVLSVTDAGGDGSLTYDVASGTFTYTGPSAAEVRSHFSSSGDLTYDSSTGQFSFDVESVYTQDNFDSDFNTSLDQAALDGVGLAYNSSDNTLSIDSSELEAYFKQDIRGYFSAAGDLTYNSASGEFSFDVESVYTQANFDSDFNTSLDNAALDGVGLAYNSSTNTLSIDSAEFTGMFTTSNLNEGDNLYYTTARADSAFDVRIATKSTTDLSEGDNKYYTKVRVDSDVNEGFAERTTDNLDEGSSNLYYTTARADSDFDARLSTKSTTDVVEGDNLYYTSSRVDSDAKNAISVTDNGGDGSLTYTPATGVIEYTGPSASETRAHFSGGNGINITDGRVDMDSAYDATFNGVTNTSGRTETSPSQIQATSDTIIIVDTEAHNSDFRSIEYVVHMDDSDAGHSQISKLLLTYNKSNVFFTEYGVISSFESDSDIGTLTADVSGGNIRLKFQRATGMGIVNIKPAKTIIK